MKKRSGQTVRWLLPTGLLLLVLTATTVGGLQLLQAFTPQQTTQTSQASGEPQSPTSPEPPAQPPAPTAEELWVETMTLHEKLCQMLLVYPSQITGVANSTVAGQMTEQALAEYPVGGLLFDEGNMESQTQLRQMMQNIAAYSTITPLLACEEEGGSVARLMRMVGTTKLDAMLSYREGGTQKAEDNARIIGQDMASVGLNFDLAPVADVWSNASNQAIGDRAYSDSFDEAASLVGAAVKGFQAGGVGCVLKYFPGQGEVQGDTATGTATIQKSLEQLRQEELLPFAAGIEAGADAVMVGHAAVAELGDTPASLSPRIVTDLLRNEMGFTGVIMTDSLQKSSITNRYDSGQAAIDAIQAGVDLLLCPSDLNAMLDSLKQAVQTGVLSEERINQSVARILTLKSQRSIWSAPQTDAAAQPQTTDIPSEVE